MQNNILVKEYLDETRACVRRLSTDDIKVQVLNLVENSSFLLSVLGEYLYRAYSGVLAERDDFTVGLEGYAVLRSSLISRGFTS